MQEAAKKMIVKVVADTWMPCTTRHARTHNTHDTHARTTRTHTRKHNTHDMHDTHNTARMDTCASPRPWTTPPRHARREKGAQVVADGRLYADSLGITKKIQIDGNIEIGETKEKK